MKISTKLFSVAIPQKKFLKSLFFIFGLLIVSGIALIGVFHKGFFISDDGNWMVIRFSAFYEALRSGQLPVRFLPRLGNGFGYPVANFLYPLFMYLAVPFKLFGASYIFSIKIILAASLLFSAIFAFLWLQSLFTPVAAFIGATIYLLFPYHLWDLYKRGSVGELLALAIIPFIFWQIQKKETLLVGVGLGLLILAHNTLAVCFLPIIFLYVLLQKFSLKNTIMVGAIGFGVSAFFWIPALAEKNLTVFDKTLVASFYGYFLSQYDFYLVGAISLVVLVASLFLIKKFNRLALSMFCLAVFSIFMVFPQSGFLWKLLPITQYIQFPYRLLSITISSITFLSAWTFMHLPKRMKLIFGIMLLSVAILSARPVLFPSGYQYYPDSFYATNQDTTTVHGEYMPTWVQQLPQGKTSKLSVEKGQALFAQLPGRQMNFLIGAVRQSTIEVHMIYYPGWTVIVDGKDVPTLVDSPYGFFAFPLTKGTHTVLLTFRETPLRLGSDIISIVSLVFVCFSLLKNRAKLHAYEKNN